MALAAVFAFVRNQGDAWNVMLDALAPRPRRHARCLRRGKPERPPPPSPIPLDLGGILGRRTAELHAAFATPTDDPRLRRRADRRDRDVTRWAEGRDAAT